MSELPPINYQLKTIHYAQCLLLLCASALCAYGLLKSFSRGAWLGTAVGIGFLIWKWINREPREIHENLEQKVGNPLSRIWRVSRLSSSFLPISVLLASVLVISFWQFRHTESPLLRRVFSVGNPNDFSWRNRVTAWQGAGHMILDKPIIGFGWGKAEEIYSKDYRAARLDESAAVQLNDYLMIGISAGVPALACLVAYLWRAMTRWTRGIRHLTPALSPIEAERESELSTINSQLSTTAAAGAAVLLIGFWFDGGLFKLPTCVVFWVLLELCRSRGSLAIYRSDEAQNESRVRHSVRAVGGESVLASRLVSSLAPPEEGGAQRTACPTINSQLSTLNFLHWLAGLFAMAALGMTTLHLGTPQLAVSERTLNIARKFIVPPKEKSDFEYLAAKNIWSNTPIKTLLQHAHLANYNRTLVNWKLDDQLYREFVLSPEIFPSSEGLGVGSAADETESRHLTPSLGTPSPPAPLPIRPAVLAHRRGRLGEGGVGPGDQPTSDYGSTRAERESAPSTILSQPSTNHAWRRPLWEYFYPRIRKESSLEAAAEIIVRNLNEVCKRSGGRNSKLEIQNSKWGRDRTITEIWRQPTASGEEFERIYVAAMRSAGIPSRLATSGQAEFWNGAEWKPAPRPVEVKGRAKVD